MKTLTRSTASLIAFLTVTAVYTADASAKPFDVYVKNCAAEDIFVQVLSPMFEDLGCVKAGREVGWDFNRGEVLVVKNRRNQVLKTITVQGNTTVSVGCENPPQNNPPQNDPPQNDPPNGLSGGLIDPPILNNNGPQEPIVILNILGDLSGQTDPNGSGGIPGFGTLGGGGATQGGGTTQGGGENLPPFTINGPDGFPSFP